MKKILFVCHGNICRSPMAEGYLKSKKSVGYEIISRGLAADTLRTTKFVGSEAEHIILHSSNCIVKLTERLRGVNMEEHIRLGQSLADFFYRLNDTGLAIDMHD